MRLNVNDLMENRFKIYSSTLSFGFLLFCLWTLYWLHRFCYYNFSFPYDSKTTKVNQEEHKEKEQSMHRSCGAWYMFCVPTLYTVFWNYQNMIWVLDVRTERGLKSGIILGKHFIYLSLAVSTVRNSHTLFKHSPFVRKFPLSNQRFRTP